MQKVNLYCDPLPSAKIVEIIWLALKDAKPYLIPGDYCPTPFLIRAKILMKQLWLNGFKWDERLPQELFTKVPGLLNYQYCQR